MITSKYSKRLSFLVFCLAFILTMCGAAAAAPANSTHSNLSISVNPTTTQVNTISTSNNINASKPQISAETTKLPDPSVYNSKGQLQGSFSKIMDAVNFAQSSSQNNDTITLAPGTYDEHGFTINKNMNFNVLNSNGVSGTATIDAQGNGPVFTIEPGLTVNLTDLYIENGETGYYAFGAAIWNHQGTLNVKDCDFVDNIATSNVNGWGGAIQNSGTLNIKDSYFIDNTGFFGGAIENEGTCIVKGSEFDGNTVNYNGDGGAICNGNYGTLNVTNCNFEENNATGDGGAIANFGKCTVTDSYLATNKKANTANNGGGIYNDKGTLTVIDDYFAGLDTAAGGAIYNLDGTVNVTGGNFTANSATGAGGAIYNNAIDATDSAGSLNVNGSTFTGNSASQGGAISSMGNDFSSSSSDQFGSLTVNNSTFKDNSAVGTEKNIQYEGGAIYSNTEPCTVTNSIFTGNTVSYVGGAIYDGPLGLLTVTGSNFTDNKAVDDGGAVYNDDATLTVIGSIFTDNSANLYEGGAIFNFEGSSKSKVTDSTFTGNTAGSSMGSGGAIENNNGILAVNYSTFTGNNATSAGGFGGAIDSEDFTTLTVNNSTFTGNNANDMGGAIQNSGTLNITGSTLTGNTASVGGAIYNGGTTMANVHFNRIFNNTVNMGGEGIYNTGGEVNATLNWWGSNGDTKFWLRTIFNAGTGSVTFNPWIVLTLTANPKSVFTGSTSAITADLLHDNKGKYYNPATYGVVPYTGSADFATTMGSILNVFGFFPHYTWINFVNGKVTSSLFGLASSGVATVSSTVDGYKVSTPVTVSIDPLTVNSIDPAINAVNVVNNKVIKVTFSELISQGSDYNSMRVINSAGASKLMTLSTIGSVLTLTPVYNYLTGDLYTVFIPTNAVKDSAGNGLAAEYASSFTIATIIPSVNSIDPTIGSVNVVNNKAIKITFSEPVTPGSAYNSITVKNSAGAVKLMTPSTIGDVLTLTPVYNYLTGDKYTVTIPANAVKDATGNGLAADYTSSFKIATIIPGVTIIDPTNNAVNVPNTKTIKITFSEPITPGSAYNSIKVINSAGASKLMTLSTSGNVLTLKPVYNYLTGYKYTITIPANAIKDSAGNGLAADYTSSFTITTT
jgi:predicted outer membrane repeat protein